MMAGFASPKETGCYVTDGSHFRAKERGWDGLQKARVLVFSLCSGYMHPGSNFNFSLSSTGRGKARSMCLGCTIEWW